MPKKADRIPLPLLKGDHSCVIAYYNSKTGKKSICTSKMTKATAIRLVRQYNKSLPHLKHEIEEL